MLGDGSGFHAEEVDEKFMETCRYCLQIYADLMENILQVFDPDTSLLGVFYHIKASFLKFVWYFLDLLLCLRCFWAKQSFHEIPGEFLGRDTL